MRKMQPPFIRKMVSLWVVIAISACSGSDADTPKDTGSIQQSDKALEWQKRADGSLFAMAGEQATRCWPIGESVDCLFAQKSDYREQMADAPVHWDYFRYLSRKLPTRPSDFEKMSMSDGYSCGVTHSGLKEHVRETLWKDGKIVAEKGYTPREYEAPGWSPKQFAQLLNENSIRPVRPYFACGILDSLVRRSGLEIIDTPVVQYEPIMLIDRLSRPSDSDEAAVDQ